MICAVGAGRIYLGNKEPFDWTSTYTLRLEMLPESHVSPRLATRILFCGKAVRMLREVSSEIQRSGFAGSGDGKKSGISAMGSSISSSTGSIYHYITTGGGSSTGAGGDGDDRRTEVSEVEKYSPQKRADMFIKDEKANDDILLGMGHVEINKDKNGYTEGELSNFIKRFRCIIVDPSTSFVNSFDSLIESVNVTISNRLWLLLKEKFGFVQFLVGLRNTYLLGKGELFQVFLDGILQLMEQPPPTDAHADSILMWEVVRAAAKILNLDDDVLSSTLKLRANSASLTVTDFFQEDLVRLHGVYTLGDMSDASRRRHIYLGKPNSDFFLKVSSNQNVRKTLPTTIPARSTVIPDNKGCQRDDVNVNSSQGTDVRLQYTSAAVSITDSKYIIKGFSSTCLFTCDWHEANKHLRPDHPIFSKSAASKDVESTTVGVPINLGTLMCVLHDSTLNDAIRSSENRFPVISSPYGLVALSGSQRCVGVGVSVYGRVVSVGTDQIDYFAKVFLWMNASPGSKGYGISSASGSSINSSGLGSLSSGRKFSSGDLDGCILASSAEIPLVFGATSIVDPDARDSCILQATASMALEVEYYRDISRVSDSGIDTSSVRKGLLLV